MLLLKARLALELLPINKALSRAAEGLPHPVRPIARHIFEAGGKRLRPLLTILMARLLGLSRESLSRELNKLAREGAIRLERRRVELLDMAALERRAQD